MIAARIFTGVLAGALLNGCAVDPEVCDDSFAFVVAVAVDAGGSLVSGLVITDSVLRTGERFVVEQFNGFEPVGSYTVFSDNFESKVREAGDAVRVTGTDGSRGFGATFVFGSDGCHIRKISGPDTVRVG